MTSHCLCNQITFPCCLDITTFTHPDDIPSAYQVEGVIYATTSEVLIDLRTASDIRQYSYPGCLLPVSKNVLGMAKIEKRDRSLDSYSTMQEVSVLSSFGSSQAVLYPKGIDKRS